MVDMGDDAEVSDFSLIEGHKYRRIISYFRLAL